MCVLRDEAHCSEDGGRIDLLAELRRLLQDRRVGAVAVAP